MTKSQISLQVGNDPSKTILLVTHLDLDTMDETAIDELALDAGNQLGELLKQAKSLGIDEIEYRLSDEGIVQATLTQVAKDRSNPATDRIRACELIMHYGTKLKSTR